MSKITHITSPAHFKAITSSAVYSIVDFYADWCGPCKTIAPIFEQLAATYAAPGRLVFLKVDVDVQQAVAQQYAVSAMPTFLILKNGTVTETIRGANPPALRAAVAKGAADAAKAPAKTSASFASGGRTLGNASGTTSGPKQAQAFPWTLPGLPYGWADTATRFVGLYLTSLLSLDGYKAAEASRFNVRNAAR